MRHSWDKLKGSDYISVPEDIGVKHQVRNCMICNLCDLRKGHVRTLSFFPVLVYYKDDELLSKERLPYGCNNKKQIKQTMFFSEEDFYIGD